MIERPLLFTWDGEYLIPVSRRTADKLLVVGQRYAFVEYADRSQASHSHQFAWLANAWRTLPETIADNFPTPEHLRKRALIDAGYYTETIIDAGTSAAALRVASHLRSKDDFAHVVVRGPLVVERIAKSQSRRAMDRKTFQESKTAIMEIVAALIGVAPEDLRKAEAA